MFGYVRVALGQFLENLRKVVGNLRKIVENVVISIFMYMVACRHGISLLVFNFIFEHSISTRAP